MNNTKKIVIGIIAIIMVAMGISYLTKPSPKPGAVATPDLPFPCFSYGGVTRCASRTVSLVQSTTTPAALQSPAATSTLVSGDCQFAVASSSVATALTLSNSTTAFSTTTGILATSTIASGAQGYINALSTSTAIVQDLAITRNSLTFSPNSYLVLGMSGGVGTFSPTGSCNAVWEVY